jgi:hypothetical protein
MTTNYRQLLEDAESQLDTYKHPDIDEFQEKFSELLEAAEAGSLKHDRVESIRVRDSWGTKMIEIRTSWSARNCAQTSEYSLPYSVIEAPDPLKAAKIWGLEKKIAEANAEASKYRGYVQSYEKTVAELTLKLENAQ